jgi:hypothetical protein
MYFLTELPYVNSISARIIIGSIQVTYMNRRHCSSTCLYPPITTATPESYIKKTQPYLGAFAKMRKATMDFVMSVRPSVCPHATTPLRRDGFLLNLVFKYFSKKVEKIKVSLKSDKN